MQVRERLRLSDEDEDMEKPDRVVISRLTFAALLSGFLCLVGLFLIFAIWFLVPNDPSLAERANIVAKLKPVTAIALLIALFAVFSNRLFALRDRKTQVE